MDEFEKPVPSGRPIRYSEAKSVKVSGRLTPTGAAYLEDKGGLDWIDRLAWGMEDEPKDYPDNG